MGRPELGTKVTCAGCRERFYDLSRSPAMCPKCGAQQPPERPRAPQPARSTSSTGLQPRQLLTTVAIDEDVEPGTTETEAEDDVPKSDGEADDDIEIDSDLAKTTD